MPYLNDEQKNRILVGIYLGFVTDRDDDSSASDSPHAGRIQVEIPALKDEKAAGTPYHFWCEACLPSNQFFSVPAVGTIVAIGFIHGHSEQPIWLGSVNTTDLNKDPPTRFRRDQPDVSGYESLQGHFLEFNDISGERRIRIEDLNGNFMEWDTELDDLNVLFKHDENREIQNDRFTIIGNDDQLDIGNDNRITIGNNQTRDIGNNQTLTVGLNQTETIGNDQTLDVGNDQTETIGNDRTQEIGNDDALTVLANKTQDITGIWDDTITDAYSMTGQSTGDWDFQDIITWTAGSDLVYSVTGDWKTDTTGDWDNTVTGDFKADVTGSIDFKATKDITLDATLTATLKNVLFSFEHAAAISTWKDITGTSSIILTPASITLKVGGTIVVIAAGGVTNIASQFIIQGIDHVTHKHPVFAVGIPTGTPQA